MADNIYSTIGIDPEDLLDFTSPKEDSLAQWEEIRQSPECYFLNDLMADRIEHNDALEGQLMKLKKRIDETTQLKYFSKEQLETDIKLFQELLQNRVQSLPLNQSPHKYAEVTIEQISHDFFAPRGLKAKEENYDPSQSEDELSELANLPTASTFTSKKPEDIESGKEPTTPGIQKGIKKKNWNRNKPRTDYLKSIKRFIRRSFEKEKTNPKFTEDIKKLAPPSKFANLDDPCTELKESYFRMSYSFTKVQEFSLNETDQSEDYYISDLKAPPSTLETWTKSMRSILKNLKNL
jgi:hypothetical protein